MQTIVAYFIVAIALLYAAWLFMPQFARRWLIAHVIAALPSSQRARFERLQSATESVGCSTCKGCATDIPPHTTVKTVTLHRR